VTTSLLAMTADELARAVAELDRPAYRAEQLADWVYRKGVVDPAKMTNLPAAFVDAFEILTSRTCDRADSRDGTVKLLIELADAEHVECVVIPTAKRMTACLSTQVGCSMGCAFCASAIGGFRRNLSSAEILEQVLHLQLAAGGRVTNVVFMGMGEPLANYDATVTAVRALIDPARFGLSARHITVSTIGLPRQIRRLAREDLPVTLAISLHAPNDALRQQLIPAAETTSIRDILDAAVEFFDARKREITLEYVLIADVNDTTVCADALARLAQPIRCNVNLIALNAVEGSPFQPSGSATVKAFADRLTKRGINVHVRRSRGADAQAACGQLRQRHETR